MEEEKRQKKEQEKREKREKRERRILRSEQRILKISFWSGLAFAVAELIFAVFSHSQSSLMDAVYDSTELVFIALIIFLTPLFHKPISEKYPYGFYQLESIFLIIKGVMMLSVTFGVSMDVLKSALSGGNPVNGALVSGFQLLLGLCSVGVYFIMKRLNRELNSPTVDAEILGWKLDIFYSLGLSLAFFGSVFLEKTPLRPLAPYFDPIVAALVAVGMLPENIRMLWGAVKDVFLVTPEESLEEVKAIAGELLPPYGFEPVFCEVTRTGRHIWVSVYFEIRGQALPLESLKEAQQQLKQAVNQALAEDCSCELILKP